MPFKIAFENHHLHGPHRESRALSRILGLLQKPLVREHVFRPLHVHIHGVAAETKANPGQPRPDRRPQRKPLVGANCIRATSLSEEEALSRERASE